MEQCAMRKSPRRSAAVPFGGGGDTGLGASQALDFGSHLADYSWRKPFSRRSQSLSSCGDGDLCQEGSTGLWVQAACPHMALCAVFQSIKPLLFPGCTWLKRNKLAPRRACLPCPLQHTVLSCPQVPADPFSGDMPYRATICVCVFPHRDWELTSNGPQLPFRLVSFPWPWRWYVGCSETTNRTQLIRITVAYGEEFPMDHIFSWCSNSFPLDST